jgi:NAD(P)-dependent dehydrogenase (short-subunit alcohol dehydrogenase family)
MSVAIVTGASRGLGRALGEGLAAQGWSLVVDARDPEGLEKGAATMRAQLDPTASLVAVAGSVELPSHRERLVAEATALGGLDLLVNNASTLGLSPLPHLAEYPIDELRRVLEVNALAPLGLIQAALGFLRRSPAPRILNITSDAAVEAYEGWGGYGAAKAALDQLSAVLAVEEPSLRVWAVDPGDLRTQMHQEAYPGEDISDRPLPETVVPVLLDLIAGDRPSGRIRLADLLGAEQ